MNEADEEDLYQRMRWTPVEDLPELAPEVPHELNHEPQDPQVLAKTRPALATTIAWQAPTPCWTEMVADANEEEEQLVAELQRLKALYHPPPTAGDVGRPPKWRLDKNGKYSSKLSPESWLTTATSSRPFVAVSGSVAWATSKLGQLRPQRGNLGDCCGRGPGAARTIQMAQTLCLRWHAVGGHLSRLVLAWRYHLLPQRPALPPSSTKPPPASITLSQRGNLGLQQGGGCYGSPSSSSL